MSLKKHSKKLFYTIIMERIREPMVFDQDKFEAMLRREAVDWLFVGLSTFTHIYLAMLAIVYFFRLSGILPELASSLEVLQNPYFAALGIYAVLKEMRKRGRDYPSRYWGELFVALWVLLAFISTILAFFVSGYGFDQVYKVILVNGVVVALVYIGATINKP